MYVHSWGALLGLSSLIVPLPPHPHPTRAACTPLSHLYSPRMPPMPHTSLTAQVSTHTPCAPHASRPLLSRLAHRQKNSQLSRLAHRSKKPRMQWRRLSSLQVGCSQESVLQCVIRLRGLEVVMQPARLAEHALDTSRRGWPAQVLPRHLGERREPLRAAGREIFWQVVIWQVPPCVPQAAFLRRYAAARELAR